MSTIILRIKISHGEISDLGSQFFSLRYGIVLRFFLLSYMYVCMCIYVFDHHVTSIRHHLLQYIVAKARCRKRNKGKRVLECFLLSTDIVTRNVIFQDAGDRWSVMRNICELKMEDDFYVVRKFSQSMSDFL